MKRQIIFATLVGIIATSATATLNLKLSLKTPDNAPIEIQKDYDTAPKMKVEATKPANDAKKGFAVSDLGLVTPAFQVAIHNEDFLTSDTTPLYTIRGSGRYYFANNIQAQRTSTTTGVVLSIDADNVTLNMNDRVLVPHVSSAHTGATAIQVSAGKSNVQIMNGTIQAMDSSGTRRFAKGIEVPTTGTVNYTVKLSNISITRLRDASGTCRAFDINGTNDFSMENCHANDCNVSNGGSATTMRGISLDTVNNLVIKDCESSNHSAEVSSDASTVVGLYMNTCVDGVVENVVTTNNHADAGSSSDVGTCYGVHVLGSSKNLSFKNVNSSSNKATSTSSGGVAGFIVNNSPINSFTDCIANNNNDAGVGSNPIGFGILGSSDNCSLVRCRAEQNTTALGSSAVYGFQITSDNNYFEDCSANGNSGTGDINSAVYGIYFSGSTENRLVRCVANYNSNASTSDDDNANAYGVFLTSSSNNNHFLECQANGNTTAAASVDVSTHAVGFYSSAGTANRFEKCIANGNSETDIAQTVHSAGFQFAGAETRSQLIECEAVGNTVGTVAGGNATGARAYGIYFSDTSGADKCIVKNCYIAYNSVLDGATPPDGLNFGFYDNNTASTSVLINNLSIGHGRCMTHTELDASNQWNNNSEPSVSQNYFWKHAGTLDDPRHVVQEAPILNFLSISTTVGDWTNISVY